MATGTIKMYKVETRKAKSPYIGVLETNERVYDFAPKHLGPDLLEDAKSMKKKKGMWEVPEEEVDFDFDQNSGEIVEGTIIKRKR